MEKTEITVVGAGIIGLAVSAALAKTGRSLYVLEKNAAFGRECSSRNSEVLHAGIYYPADSLKASCCVEGNRLTREICAKNAIACKKLGKFIIAENQKETETLNLLLENGSRNGVKGLELIEKKTLHKFEPHIRAAAALYSPDTAIVDSHSLMRHFMHRAVSQGAEFVFGAEVTKIERHAQGYRVDISDSDQSTFSFHSRILINCAGLNSDILAQSAGIDTEKAGYMLQFCKGEYFRVGSKKSRLVKHLIYPVPDKEVVSLGVHATPDLAGGLRLGPDAQYIDREDANYEPDISKKESFWQAVHRFLPFIEMDDLVPDTAGIRPKLQAPQEDFRDFVICHEEAKGFPGLINLIGIESPGLTAAAVIAGYVRKIVEKII